MVVGDMNVAWHVGERIADDGPGFVFAKVTDTLAPADLVIGNLECTLDGSGEPWPGKEEHFAAPGARAVAALTSGGIDIVTMANNHSLDFGSDGLVHSIGLLDAAGIRHVGAGADDASAGAPLIVESNGVRLALLNYVLPFSSKAGFNTRAWEAHAAAPGVAIGRPETVGADVRAAKQLADVVIVLVHSGGEFRRYPKNNQIAFASAAAEAGAQLVIGAGPHNLQGYVRRNHTLIAYSLGNFVFDEYTGRQNDTAILDVKLSADGVDDVSWIPIEIDVGLPRPATSAEAERIMAQLELGPQPD
jgi:poly-gamma-glutamate capsule biosynthesis protein CapA/YwtB (metallophosphatase superfamily)